MIEKPVYFVTVQTANESSRFDRAFLFEPTPADIILALQDRIGDIEQSIGEGDEEDDEYLSHDLESLGALCEVMNAVSKPFCCIDGMKTNNPVLVAGTLVGNIFIERCTALDR